MGFDLGDLTAIEPSNGGGSYQVLPRGQYKLTISEVSDKTLTKKGGSYVYVEYTVAEGDLEGSTFRVFYNIENDNAKTVEIAWRDLAALGLSTGVPGGDSDLLLGKTFMAMVGTKPAYVDQGGTQRGESNNILKYYRPDETPANSAPTPLRQTPIAAPAARPTVVGGNRPAPWKARA